MFGILDGGRCRRAEATGACAGSAVRACCRGIHRGGSCTTPGDDRRHDRADGCRLRRSALPVGEQQVPAPISVGASVSTSASAVIRPSFPLGVEVGGDHGRGPSQYRDTGRPGLAQPGAQVVHRGASRRRLTWPAWPVRCRRDSRPRTRPASPRTVKPRGNSPRREERLFLWHRESRRPPAGSGREDEILMSQDKVWGWKRGEPTPQGSAPWSAAAHRG